MPKKPERSIEILRRAMELHEKGDMARAEKEYRQVLAGDPKNIRAWENLGVLYAQQGKFAEAEPAFRKVIEIAPGLLPRSVYHLSRVLLGLKRTEEAAQLLREYLDMVPPTAELLLELASDLEKLNRMDDAIKAAEQAAAIAPADPEPLLRLAGYHQRLFRQLEPIDFYRRVLELRPDMVEARRILAHLLQLCGRIEEALVERQRLVDEVPSRDEFLREMIIDLGLADRTPEDVARARRLWHERFAAPLIARAAPHRNDPDPERRLKIAYMGGPQLQAHTLAAVLAPAIQAHDREKFELYAYSDLTESREDGFSALYRKHMVWRRVGDLSEEQLAAQIRADGIDVVIDPLSFTVGSRMATLAHRPAPIQISFPTMGSAGGGTIDYVVADRRIMTDQERAIYPERVIEAPIAYCYWPLVTPPAVAPPPYRANGFITFASMNFLPKLTDRSIALWGRVLAQVPNSRLLVKAGRSFRDEGVRNAFLARLEANGITRARVIMKAYAPTQTEHLATYNEIDISLDFVPYGGVTTTFDALTMGVPVVTRVGDRLLDRYCYSILDTIGFTEGIAFTDDEYVARAIALASDLDRLLELRRTLRTMLFKSPACDARSVVGAMEKGIRDAWREWCARQKAAGSGD